MCKGSVVCEGEKKIVEFDDDDDGDDDEELAWSMQRLQGSLVSNKAGAIGRSSSKITII